MMASLQSEWWPGFAGIRNSVLSLMTPPKFKRIAGALATLVLHTTLLVLIAKPAAQGELPETIEPPRSMEPLIATVFLFEEPDAPAVESRRERLALTMESPNSITLPIPPLPAIEAIAADSFEEGRQIATLDDLKSVEHLQGIYVRQITDRIARVLELAGGYRGAPSAHCIVYVIQNETGDVVDVDMNDCRRDPQEQQRLAGAIREASPLPLPPAGYRRRLNCGFGIQPCRREARRLSDLDDARLIAPLRLPCGLDRQQIPQLANHILQTHKIVLRKKCPSLI
jgi:hypothetical protein